MNSLNIFDSKILLLLLLISIFCYLFIFSFNNFITKSKFSNSINSKIPNSVKGYNYLKMEEEDFDILNNETRWKYRTDCLNNFSKYKSDYKRIKYIYPLPISNNNDLIFVNIASYRDPECNKTIQSLINNSDNWENLRIQVCQQNAENDIDAYHELPDKFKKIVHVNRISHKEARGPTWARFLIQQEYNGEEYYLQIDSHTVFEKSWDTTLKKMLNKLPYKSCLTQYLPEYSNKKLIINLLVNKICSLDGFTRINSDYVNSQLDYNKSSPFPSNGWSGCFSFSRGDICRDAPIDPYTPDLFFGEEMDIALRLYTRGWNFYAPQIQIAYTNFNRNYRNTFWEKREYNKDITLCSRLRIHYRIGTLPINIRNKIEQQYSELLIDNSNFSLGNERTLQDYEKLIKFKLN